MHVYTHGEVGSTTAISVNKHTVLSGSPWILINLMYRHLLAVVHLFEFHVCEQWRHKPSQRLPLLSLGLKYTQGKSRHLRVQKWRFLRNVIMGYSCIGELSSENNRTEVINIILL